MSQFDAAAFLDATTTQESVKRPPIPAGEYRAVIGELVAEPWVSSRDPSKAGMKFNVPLTIDLPADVQAQCMLDSPTLTVKDSMMLDVNAAGQLDYAPGRNAKLRKYREATGNNNAGQPFAPRMLQGNVVTVKIGHREYPEGSGDFFENVEGIAKAV